MKSVQQIAEKWKRNYAAAGPSYVAGVQGVSVAPGQAAARAADKWAAGVQKAISDGTFASESAKVPLGEWQAAAIAGSKNMAQGAAKGAPKQEAFMAEFLPFVSGVQAQVKAMPSTTEADREERALTNMRRLREFKRRGR